MNVGLKVELKYQLVAAIGYWLLAFGFSSNSRAPRRLSAVANANSQ